MRTNENLMRPDKFHDQKTENEQIRDLFEENCTILWQNIAHYSGTLTEDLSDYEFGECGQEEGLISRFKCDCGRKIYDTVSEIVDHLREKHL
jgi:hypothetical protein